MTVEEADAHSTEGAGAVSRNGARIDPARGVFRDADCIVDKRQQPRLDDSAS